MTTEFKYTRRTPWNRSLRTRKHMAVRPLPLSGLRGLGSQASFPGVHVDLVAGEVDDSSCFIRP